jgi:hypothetical protein
VEHLKEGGSAPLNTAISPILSSSRSDDAGDLLHRSDVVARLVGRPRHRRRIMIVVKLALNCGVFVRRGRCFGKIQVQRGVVLLAEEVPLGGLPARSSGGSTPHRQVR